MPLSWNEIRHNAIKFSGKWKGARSESAEKQTFWNEFFQVFGIKRRVVASFEEPANEGRHAEIPRYIIVCDFARIALHDVELEKQRGLPVFDKRRGTAIEFPLADFHRYIHAFAFIPGYKQHTYKEEDPINIEAA